MIRRVTNFGSYEPDGVAKVARWRRVLWSALRIALLALAVSLAGLFLFPAKPAHAGRSCETRKPTPEMIIKGMQLAERTSQALAARSAGPICSLR